MIDLILSLPAKYWLMIFGIIGISWGNRDTLAALLNKLGLLRSDSGSYVQSIRTACDGACAEFLLVAVEQGVTPEVAKAFHQYIKERCSDEQPQSDKENLPDDD